MRKILISAGGTRENIDPVRYIGNHSSGKMGLALADEAYNKGFDVLLVSTFEVDKPYKVEVATSSNEMLEVLKREFVNTDILIMAAAVADFKPVKTEKQKIKKSGNDFLTITLEKTPDILKELSAIKKSNQILIGFCAESEKLLANAQKKLQEKNLDYIVANDISRKDIGFGSEDNEITIMSKDGTRIFVDKMKKTQVAKKIFEICIK